MHLMGREGRLRRERELKTRLMGRGGRLTRERERELNARLMEREREGGGAGCPNVTLYGLCWSSFQDTTVLFPFS